MKTTNNISNCTFNKIINQLAQRQNNNAQDDSQSNHHHGNQQFGIIIKPVKSKDIQNDLQNHTENTNLKQEFLENYELCTLNNSVLILVTKITNGNKDDQDTNYLFQFEGGVKRIYDDKNLLINKLKENNHQLKENSQIILFRDENLNSLIDPDNFVGLYRLEQSQIYAIGSINNSKLTVDMKAFDILKDNWNQVLQEDSLSF